MSSLPERIEKRCLNCNSLIYGRYCQVCGQENVNHHVGFFHLVRHFVFDIFHFEGKFFHTLKALFTRPGQAAKEYVEGKRMRHLDPVKMYVFTSAIFFLIFFKIWQPEIKTTVSTTTDTADTATQSKAADTAARTLINGFDISPYRTVKAFDSAQGLLPKGERKSGIMRMMIRRSIYLRDRYNYSGESMIRALMNDFLHRLPQAMFVTLPLFALLLQLLYFRSKKWQYFDHGVFSIHVFVTGFIVILAALFFDALSRWTGLSWISHTQTILGLGLLALIYLAMRRFYNQPRWKTLVKWLLLMLAGMIMLGMVLLLFLILSFVNM